MTKVKTGLKDFVKPHRRRYIASVTLAVCGVLFGLVPYAAIYRFLVLMARAQCTGNDVFFYAAVVMVSLVLQILFHTFSTTISHKTAFSILEQLKVTITQKIMRTPLGYTQGKGGGYFKDMLIEQIERLEYPLAHALPETTSGVLLPVAIMVFLFFVDRRIALAVLVPAAGTLLFYLPMYIGIMNDFAGTYYHKLAAMNGRVIEYITGIKEIKIFGRANDAYGKYEASIEEYRSSTLRLYKKMYFVTSPALILLSSILVSVLCIGGLLYCTGGISAFLFLFTIIISIGIGAPLLKFTEFMDNFYHIKNGMRLIREAMSTPELPQTETGRASLQGHEIVFHDVGFSYERKTVLEHISLVFREHQKTALVGPSGAGKTTVANLIARFWDVSSGSITLGGVDYRDIPLNQLMENINYVTQDPFLFNMSIRENILVGKPGASEAEIISAAQAAQCDEFIRELEHGYDTVAGDAGMKLSGGQRQRIIIARAILRNAPVLILDEATAFADMENQQKIQASLHALCRDKCLILIAHRLSTVVDCDQIVVINDGKVDSTGIHENLLEISVLYRNMWNAYCESANWSIGKDTEVEPCLKR
jgi:ATP-binding cassette subfamily B protein